MNELETMETLKIKKEDIKDYLDTDYCLITLEQWNNIKKLVKSYKDKEDKLREYCKEQDNISDGYELDADYLSVGDYKHIIKDILQILNEGENNE